MGASPALDLDLLRTLIAIAEEGSFTRAAERVGRTQSAVSLQVQRLEALVGRTLVTRGKGGGVELTAQGEELVARGRALLALNDDIVQTVRGQTSHGVVRLGVGDAGYARHFVPDILARFAAAHPTTAVVTTPKSSCELMPMLSAGELDLALCVRGLEPRRWPAIEVWRTPLAWITSDAFNRHLDDPLPLALSPGNCPFKPPWLADCLWRDQAKRTLERAGRRYAIASTSVTIAGQHDAVLAGLAIGVSPPIDLPAGLRAVRPDEGLPPLPDMELLLLKAREPRQPVTDALYAHILEAFVAQTRTA